MVPASPRGAGRGRAAVSDGAGARTPGVPGPGPAEGPEPTRTLGLWEGFGVEIELMIVDRETLDVRPVADRLFRAVGGSEDTEIVTDEIGWSNELALHVLELKTWGPAPSLAGLAERFQRAVRRAHEALEPLGCRLLPGGAHPWMDPARDFRIWPHEYTDVYHAFDRIFSCSGHGWANLQSTHLNLPFRDDRELALLHETVRIVLPIIPALSASSPVLDGRVGPALDNRLLAYRDNARRVPSVTGRVIPEPVRSRAEYETRILEPIYRDLAELDPAGVLRHEWVNARGAIARFTRGAVEIRVVDAQECPRADLAVTAAVVAAVRRAAELLGNGSADEPLGTEALAGLLDRVVHRGRRARLEGLDLPARFGVGPVPDVGALWARLLEDTLWRDPGAVEWRDPLEVILDQGCLSERILAALGLDPARSAGAEPGRLRLRRVWEALADTLEAGRIFKGAP